MKREKVLFRGDRVSLWDDDEALEKESGDDDPILQMYLVPRNCTLSRVHFTLNRGEASFTTKKKSRERMALAFPSGTRRGRVGCEVGL